MKENENMNLFFIDEEEGNDIGGNEAQNNVPPIPGSFFTEYNVPTEMPEVKSDFTESQPVTDVSFAEAYETAGEVTEEVAVEVQTEAEAEPEAEIEAEVVEEAEVEAETEAEAETVEEAEVEAEAVQEVPLQQEAPFNPYAPKNPTENSFNGYQNQGINPSYNRPVYGNNPYNNQNTQQNYPPAGYYTTPDKDKGSKGKKIAVGVVAVCVIVAVIALVSSFFGGSGNNIDSTQQTTTTAYGAYVEQTTQPTTQSVTVATTQPVTQVINSVWVAEKVRPSVVGVMAYSQGSLAGEGSGVLMSEDLSKGVTYIVTCAHVIDDPSCEFGVLLLDGSRYDAEVVALDVRTDIGVLKVNKTGLPLAEFGDSSTLKIGEPIYAIGNPGGSEYFGSITNGIIAAIDRSISATYTMTCIQHNAAINPGNSGGALVNSAGQVIGINSSKIAKTDYEGMGFAVPSSIFRSVVTDLIQYGYVPNRPELGIKYATVSDYQLYSIIVSIKGLPKGSIIIADIPEGSALSGTNAQVGDLIIAVNGKKMDTSDVLLDLIDTGAVGDTLTLTLCRINDRSYDTSTFDVTVQLVEDKGSVTTTTQAQTLPQNDPYSDFEDFFGGFFGW